MERQGRTLGSVPPAEIMTSKAFIFSEPNVLIFPKSIGTGVSYEETSGTSVKENSFTFASPAAVPQSGTQDAFAFYSNIEKQYKPKISRHSYKPAMNLFAQTLKDTAMFEQLKKNSRSQVAKLNSENSITCINVPQSLLTKALAKEYFTTFGNLLKIAIRPKKQTIIVTYATKEEANVAYQNGGEYFGERFNIEWSKACTLPRSPTKKKNLQKNVVSNFLKSSEDEIKSELDAMVNLEYNLHNSKDNFDGTLFKRNKVLQSKGMGKSIIKVEKASLKNEKHKSDSQISDILPNASMEELQNIIHQSATTSEDKYKVLEARDRLMRMKQVKSQTLAAAKVMVGTCPDMCPEKERLMRESTRQVALYEQLDSNEYKINHTIAVKQYSRSSADQEEPMAHELRPVISLKMTMSYLLHEIADLCDHQSTNLGEWYHFLWDRTRGIRKDITQQELCCVDSVELVEQCARFHILCSERLCAEEPSIFDKKINSDNLTKCLQSLKYMYHDLRVKGISCKNEPEFRAYIILLNLNNGNFMWDLQRLPKGIQKSPEVQFALKVYSALESNDYYKFFKLVRETTYLNACILLRYFNQVRLKALSVMVKAYCRTTSTAYPLYELIDILGFEDETEAINFCEQVGLNAKDELHVLLNRQNFVMPELNIKHNRACNLIESKRTMAQISVGECIAGGKMPEKTYKYHIPHNSFDSHGYLMSNSINAEDQSKSIISKQPDPHELIGEDTNTKYEKSLLSGDILRKSTEVVVTVGHSNIFQSIANSESVANIFTVTKSESNIFTSKPQMQSSTLYTGINVKLKPEVEQQEDSRQQDFSSIESKSNESFQFSDTFNTTTTAEQPFNIFSKAFEVQRNSNYAQGNISVKSLAPSTTYSTTSTTAQTASKPPDIANTVTTMTNNKLTGTSCFLIQTNQVQKEELRDVKIDRSNVEENVKRKQQINEIIEDFFNALETEIVQECCCDIVKEEINNINICNRLNENLNQIIMEVIHEACNEVLKEEIDYMQKLHEMSMKMKNGIIIKYFNIWKTTALKRRQQRKALDDTPVWLQKYSSKQCAKLLYSKEQDVVIQNMCKRQEIQKTASSYIDSLAPIEVIVYIGIKENLKMLNTNICSNHYWKLVISWPDLHNKTVLWYHKKIMNQYLCPEDYTIDPIIKVYQPNQIETLYICIRNFEGVISDHNLIGSDALLFIAAASEDIKFVMKRLTKNILSRNKLMPIPLVFIVLGDAYFDAQNREIVTNLEKFLKLGFLSTYTIMYENDLSEETILNLTQSAMLWLSINKSARNPLEMDYLYNVCNACLTEELWLRILDDSSFNKKLPYALKEPKFIIDLHNEAVDHLTDIILDPETFMYTKFAPELNKFVRNQYMIPCSYEHFDDSCKKGEYKEKVETIMSSLKVPQWKYPWQIDDSNIFRQNIINYCQEALSNFNIEIANDILYNLFFTPGVSTVSNFIDVLLYVLKNKLCFIDEDLKVIYNKVHMRHFRTLPWWLKSNLLAEYTILPTELNSRKHGKENEEEIDTIEPIVKKPKLYRLKQNHSELEPLATYCENSQSLVMNVHRTSKQIEDRLKTQQEQNFLFEEKLRNALCSEIKLT